MVTVPTRSAVRKAGSAVRKFARGEIPFEQLEPHVATLTAYRDSFSYPLEQFHDRLVSVQVEAGIEAETTRRLKRVPTILDKLEREPTLDLSKMQDIGGCRSVVRSLDEVYALRDLVTSHWECEERDYVLNPRTSGYRSIHLVASFEETVIELQLRTQVMQDWAQTVEAFSALIGDNFKQDGSHVVQDYLRVLSEMMHSREIGAELDSEVAAKLDRLRPQISKIIDDVTRGVEKHEH